MPPNYINLLSQLIARPDFHQNNFPEASHLQPTATADLCDFLGEEVIYSDRKWFVNHQSIMYNEVGESK